MESSTHYGHYYVSQRLCESVSLKINVCCENRSVTLKKIHLLMMSCSCWERARGLVLFPLTLTLHMATRITFGWRNITVWPIWRKSSIIDISRAKRWFFVVWFVGNNHHDRLSVVFFSYTSIFHKLQDFVPIEVFDTLTVDTDDTVTIAETWWVG